MKNIFISYRRGDSIATAGRIRDRLVQDFGRGRVFVDVYDIPHGRDFVEVLEGQIAECGVLLAIIGPNWLEARDESGKRRLEDKDDVVGIEIGSALERKAVAVIPVLVDGAQMPSAADLPDRLKPLARRNAIELRNSQFGSDAVRLINSINEVVGGGGFSPAARTIAWAAVLAMFAGGAYLAWMPLQQMLAAPQREAAGQGQAGGTAAITPTSSATKPVQKVPPSRASPGGNHQMGNLEVSLRRLREVLAPASGKVEIGITGGNRVRLGDPIVFEVASKVAGKLVVIDINASGEVTQIFPNKFVTSEALVSVSANTTTTVPGPGYGFSGFKAVEPSGSGRLVAVVVPTGTSVAGLTMVEEEGTRGFEPVSAPEAYLDQIVRRATETARARAGVDTWGFAVVDYEITK